MKCVEDYLERIISFFAHNMPIETISKSCDLGVLEGNIEVQSMLQETPYCFNRLKVHFSVIYLSHNQITNEMVLDVLEMSTNQPFLQQIVANMPHNVLK